MNNLIRLSDAIAAMNKLRQEDIDLNNHMKFDAARAIDALNDIDISNACENCKWESKSEFEMPCSDCAHGHLDRWEPI